MQKWGFLFPKNMKTEELYIYFKQNPQISTDTRNIIPGSIFFALKGATFNGNAFAEESLKKGAAFAVVDEPTPGSDPRILRVDDVLTSLQNLATHHRRALKIPVIAITGTNGKTTTKELTSAVLSKKFNLIFTQGNLNNHIGVPLTILKMNASHEMAVIEMGANHPGEIDALCRIAEPDFGMITNVGKAHLEGFGSFEGVIQTKTEMYRFLNEKGGRGFVNADNEILCSKLEKLPATRYGTTEKCDLRGEAVNTEYLLTVKALFPKGWLYLKSKLIGAYNTENILAAACIGQYFGVDPIAIQEAIAAYTPSNNRSQLIETGTNTLIMDAYNANPTSMMAALQNFISIEKQGKVVILGDMLELGEVSETEHQRIVDFICQYSFDEIFLVGNQFSQSNLNEKIKEFKHVELLSDYLTKQPLKNKLILLKGSRGISLEKIVGNL